MGRVIQFEEQAVARLRDRLGAAESARADLLAYARGHSGAVATIHLAVIAALEADSFDALVAVVTREWPTMLRLDSVALALVVGGQGFRLDSRGVEHLEPALVDRALAGIDEVALREVGRGHPLFGAAATSVRAEALVGLEGAAPWPYGLLLLGQSGESPTPSAEGTQLLQFLGASLGAMLRRWARTG